MLVLRPFAFFSLFLLPSFPLSLLLFFASLLALSCFGATSGLPVALQPKEAGKQRGGDSNRRPKTPPRRYEDAPRRSSPKKLANGAARKTRRKLVCEQTRPDTGSTRACRPVMIDRRAASGRTPSTGDWRRLETVIDAPRARGCVSYYAASAGRKTNNARSKLAAPIRRQIPSSLAARCSVLTV